MKVTESGIVTEVSFVLVLKADPLIEVTDSGIMYEPPRPLGNCTKVDTLPSNITSSTEHRAVLFNDTMMLTRALQ